MRPRPVGDGQFWRSQVVILSGGPQRERAVRLYVVGGSERGNMDSITVKVEQMIAREVRMARGWLITVAVLSFAQGLLHAFNLPLALEGKQRLFVIGECAVFAVFFVLWLLARKKPKHSLIAALVVFWVAQTGAILTGSMEDAFAVFPIIMRLAFTLALIGGISAAYRAEEMARNRQAPETAAAPDGGRRRRGLDAVGPIGTAAGGTR